MSEFQFQKFEKAEEIIFLIFCEIQDRLFLQAARHLVLAFKAPSPCVLQWWVPLLFFPETFFLTANFVLWLKTKQSFLIPQQANTVDVFSGFGYILESN